MIQSRTHNCNELRIGNVGERVTLVGWFENMRKVSKNLGFVILRDFYGTTQLVVETEEMMNVMDGINKESTISVEGVVRERSSKNANLPTGEIEVVPDKIEILGKCIYNALPFEINQSKDADENARLKYRYLDLRNPNITLTPSTYMLIFLIFIPVKDSTLYFTVSIRLSETVLIEIP